jgi:hypothetical protein
MGTDSEMIMKLCVFLPKFCAVILYNCIRDSDWERPYIIGYTLKWQQVVIKAGESRGVPDILPAKKSSDNL